MPKFILLIREDLTRYPMEDAQVQNIINAHRNWAKNLSERGLFIAGNGMPEQGTIVEFADGKIVTSPLRDIKEGIGGFYIIQTGSFEAAVEIAKECPTFSDGDKIEVRPLM